MLKIEIVRFEAQDVITASGPVQGEWDELSDWEE